MHLGFNGFRKIHENSLRNARLLSRALEASGYYVCVSDIHRKKGTFTLEEGAQALLHSAAGEESSEAFNAGLPVIAFRLSDEFKKENPHVKQVSVSNLLRARQYIIPSKKSHDPAEKNFERAINRLTSHSDYPLPPDEESVEILRIVVRESMSRDLLDRLIADIYEVTEALMKMERSELLTWQPGQPTSLEKKYGSTGLTHEDRHLAARPMSDGVHRTVC